MFTRRSLLLFGIVLLLFGDIGCCLLSYVVVCCLLRVVVGCWVFTSFTLFVVVCGLLMMFIV